MSFLIEQDAIDAITALRQAAKFSDVLDINFPMKICDLPPDAFSAYERGLKDRKRLDVQRIASKARVDMNGRLQWQETGLHSAFHQARDAVIEAERRASPNGKLPQGTQFRFVGRVNNSLGEKFHADARLFPKSRVYVARMVNSTFGISHHRLKDRWPDDAQDLLNTKLARNTSQNNREDLYRIADVALNPDHESLLSPLQDCALHVFTGFTPHKKDTNAKDGAFFRCSVRDPDLG